MTDQCDVNNDGCEELTGTGTSTAVNTVGR